MPGRILAVKVRRQCSRCNGTGMERLTYSKAFLDCQACAGRGWRDEQATLQELAAAMGIGAMSPKEART
jgi:DnaJ-class molecular chaperone